LPKLSTMTTSRSGTVSYFNAEKGYGFITPDGAGADVFVHITNCPDHVEGLRQGQRVHFDVREASRKRGRIEAVEIKVI
jgi:CspA family cold shock protein